MPLAAVAGRKDVMSLFDKSVAGDQWLMQVGTLSGNPIAAVAGLKTLEILKRPGQFERLRDLGDRIQSMLVNALSERGSRTKCRQLGVVRCHVPRGADRRLP